MLSVASGGITFNSFDYEDPKTADTIVVSIFDFCLFIDLNVLQMPSLI